MQRRHTPFVIVLRLPQILQVPHDNGNILHRRNKHDEVGRVSTHSDKAALSTHWACDQSTHEDSEKSFMVSDD